MDRFSKLLVLFGALCFLAAGVSIGLALAAPQETSAAGALGLGTATPPPLPTEEPSAAPPTATLPPTARPIEPSPVAPLPTSAPRRRQPRAEPTGTPPPTVTPEEWITDVEIRKQASQTELLPGDTLVYTLLARNLGARTAFDVQVSDQLPAQFAVIDLTSTKGDIAVLDQTISAYPGTLDPGEVAEFRITVRVRAEAGPGEVANTGRISTSTSGDAPDNDTSTVIVEIHEPQRQIQTVQAPPRLPRTTEELPAPAIAVLATISPLMWVGMFGGLSLLLGGVLSWGLRGWLRRAPERSSSVAQLATDDLAALAFRVPPAAPAGPPRLGAALPAAAPLAPLPPLVQLDRDDALRDALRSSQAE